MDYGGQIFGTKIIWMGENTDRQTSLPTKATDTAMTVGSGPRIRKAITTYVTGRRTDGGRDGQKTMKGQVEGQCGRKHGQMTMKGQVEDQYGRKHPSWNGMTRAQW